MQSYSLVTKKINVMTSKTRVHQTPRGVLQKSFNARSSTYLLPLLIHIRFIVYRWPGIDTVILASIAP